MKIKKITLIAIFLIIPAIILKQVTASPISGLEVYFLDQTTTNMIQGLKGIFARKPLISRGT